MNGLKRIFIKLFKFLRREHPEPPKPPKPIRPPERKPIAHMSKVGFKPKTAYEKKLYRKNSKLEEDAD
jgi:hypothetical protein